jgi:hypothetical protein
MRPLTYLVSALLLAAAPFAEAASKPTVEAPEAAETEDIVEQLRAAVAALREEVFRPGPPIPGWNVGGGDPDAELAAAGADRHYLLLSSDDGEKSVVILTPRPIADFAPASWRVVDSYGSAADAVERPFVQFSPLSPRYVIATRANGFRRDTIDCSDRVAHALLYELPGTAMTEADEMSPMLFRLGLLAMEGMTSCTRYEGSRAQGWLARPLLPDGRSLPALAEPVERATIVPAAPVDELMRR